MLVRKMREHGTAAWLVNTGWSGGAYGVGSRMKLAYTRRMVDAALEGELDEVATIPHPVFGVGVPVECPGIPDEILNPRETWEDKDAYDAQARDLAGRFNKNFKKFVGEVSSDVVGAGPNV